ncbi:MAG TPA: ABC transporter permease [Clostridia bacterium]|nr:ABC transporter permease [Clostridia bacterium]
MIYYLLRRLVGAAAVLFGVVTGTFVLSHVVPSCPACAVAGLRAGPAQVAAAAHSLGLDRPVWDQYVTYISGLIHGDFGVSYASRQPIGPAMITYLPATLELVFYSFIVYAVLGVGLGMVWAWRGNRPETWLIRVFSMLGTAMPVFWFAMVLQLWLGSRLGWFPITGRLEVDPPPTVTGFYTIDALVAGNLTAFTDAVWHLVLPVTALVMWLFAVAARLTQKSVSEEMQMPYVRTAIAKGASTRRIMLRHVFRNAINPVITMLGLQFGWLLGGTVLVEVVFSWPGIGTYMFNALQTFDFPAIMAVTVIITLGFVGVNLVVDLIYPLVDPRIRVN